MPVITFFITILVIGVFIWGGVRLYLMNDRLEKLEDKVDAFVTGEIERLISS